MKGNIENMVADTQAQMLRITMDGHAYLLKHGQNDKRDYHSVQLNKLNQQYKHLTGRFYTFRHRDDEIRRKQ